MTMLVLTPKVAAETVCHDEQMTVWETDLLYALELGDFLRDGLSYDEGVELRALIRRELRDIIESAFDHPEARTIKVRR